LFFNSKFSPLGCRGAPLVRALNETRVAEPAKNADLSLLIVLSIGTGFVDVR